jgi:hypothetical protein
MHIVYMLWHGRVQPFRVSVTAALHREINGRDGALIVTVASDHSTLGLVCNECTQ